MIECFDIYDSSAKWTGKWGVKGVTVLKPGEFMRGANLWLVDSNGQFLIQKRAKELKNAPDKWAMTGGSVMHNETTEGAAVREMEEELGIRLKEQNLLLVETFIKGNFVIDAFVERVQNIPRKDMVLQRTEVQDAKWVSSEEIDMLVEKGEFMDTDWEAVKKFVAENM